MNTWTLPGGGGTKEATNIADWMRGGSKDVFEYPNIHKQLRGSTVRLGAENPLLDFEEKHVSGGSQSRAGKEHLNLCRKPESTRHFIFQT